MVISVSTIVSNGGIAMSTAIAEIPPTQECCYLATPEHIRSFVGRFIWIYVAKGRLILHRGSLVCEVSNLACEIPLREIRRVEIGHYSRWAKPITLKYIALTYTIDGQEKTVLLTPTHSWATPVWETNSIVETWAELLRESIERPQNQEAFMELCLQQQGPPNFRMFDFLLLRLAPHRLTAVSFD
jgi:hypothetical protein